LLGVMVLFSEGLPGCLVLLGLASLGFLRGFGNLAVRSCHVFHLLLFGFAPVLTLPAA